MGGLIGESDVAGALEVMKHPADVEIIQAVACGAALKNQKLATQCGQIQSKQEASAGLTLAMFSDLVDHNPDCKAAASHMLSIGGSSDTERLNKDGLESMLIQFGVLSELPEKTADAGFYARSNELDRQMLIEELMQTFDLDMDGELSHVELMSMLV